MRHYPLMENYQPESDVRPLSDMERYHPGTDDRLPPTNDEKEKFERVRAKNKRREQWRR